MNVKTSLFLFICGVLLCAPHIKSETLDDSLQKFKVAGGDINSFSIGLSGLMCQIMSQQKDQCKVEVTSGSLESLLGVQRREQDFSVVPEYLLQKFFYSEGGDYTRKYVQSIMSLGDLYFYIVVRKDSDIKKFEDLKHKNISIHPSDRASSAIVDGLLEAYEFKKDTDIMVYEQMSTQKAIPKFCAQGYHALAFKDSDPSMMISLIQKNCLVKVLPVPRKALDSVIKKNNPFIIKPYSSYGHFQSITSLGQETLVTRLILITNDSLSGNLVFDVLKEIKENFFFINAYHPSLRDLKFLEGFKKLPIPMHIGTNWFLQSIKFQGEGTQSEVPMAEYVPRTLDVIYDVREGQLEPDNNQVPVFSELVVDKMKEEKE